MIFIYKPPIFVKYEDVQSINFARSGGTNRSFDIEVSTRGDTVYTFSSIEKDEYSRLYDFFKAKKIAVKTVGKMEPGKLDLASNNIDHHAELVKANAASDDESCSANALHARLAVVIELHQLSNTQSLTALQSISFR